MLTKKGDRDRIKVDHVKLAVQKPYVPNGY